MDLFSKMRGAYEADAAARRLTTDGGKTAALAEARRTIDAMRRETSRCAAAMSSPHMSMAGGAQQACRRFRVSQSS
jgi:hypothetical protein